MKIDVTPIIKDHLNTLRDHRTGKRSLFDFTLFFVAPLASIGVPIYFKMNFDTNFYNLSITFFGIFIALLLNVQVAIFGIFQRKWEKPEDEHLASIQAEKLKERRALLGELNANLSYLVLFSCISLVSFLAFYVLKIDEKIPSCATFAIYTHFVLTLFMSVKRAHVLFQMEYDGNN